jgi:hypothetical protein
VRFVLTKSERALWTRTARVCWRAAERLRAVNRARAKAGPVPKGEARTRLLQAERRLDELDLAHGYQRPGRKCPRCGFVDCSCQKYTRHTPELPERLPMAERQLELFRLEETRELEEDPASLDFGKPKRVLVCSDCDRRPLLNDKCSSHLFDRPPAARRRAARRAPRLPVGP